MTIPANHVTALIGPSGAGKTTLLRAMNRLHDATRGAVVSGSIRHDGMDLYGPGSDPVLVRTRIGMVFQRPNVFPTMSILDNVVSGLRFAGIRRKSMLNEAAESALILPRSGTRCDTGCANLRRACREASSNGSVSPGHSRLNPTCSSWTSPRPRWIQRHQADRRAPLRARRPSDDRDRYPQHAAGASRVRLLCLPLGR